MVYCITRDKFLRVKLRYYKVKDNYSSRRLQGETLSGPLKLAPPLKQFIFSVTHQNVTFSVYCAPAEYKGIVEKLL